LAVALPKIKYAPSQNLLSTDGHYSRQAAAVACQHISWPAGFAIIWMRTRHNATDISLPLALPGWLWYAADTN
jgi:hypothetical protein